MCQGLLGASNGEAVVLFEEEEYITGNFWILKIFQFSSDLNARTFKIVKVTFSDSELWILSPPSDVTEWLQEVMPQLS